MHMKIDSQRLTDLFCELVAVDSPSFGERAMADLLTVYDETPDATQPLTIFDPVNTWKTKTFTSYTLKELLVPIFQKGECVYQSPAIDRIRQSCMEQTELLWDEVKRFENPHRYYVDLSQKLWDIKHALLKNASKPAK